jgi:PAS domain S-box-containing protein
MSLGQEGIFSHVPQLIHIICAITYVCLAIYIIVKKPRAALNWTCAGVILCFGLWSAALSVSHDPQVSRATAGLFYDIGSLAWGSFASFAALFIATFLDPRSRLPRSKLLYLALALPPPLVFYAQWSGQLVAGYVKVPWGWAYSWQTSPWSFFFYAYFSVYMLTGLGLVVRASWRAEDPIKRRQAWIMSATAFLPLLLSTLTDVVLPWLDVHAVPNMAPDFTMVWVVGLVYAIARHRMLELSPTSAAEEIVAAMSDALLLVDRGGRISMANQAARVLLGYEHRGVLVGKQLDYLFPRRLRDEQQQNVDHKTGQHELVLERRDGERLRVIFSTAELKGTAGEPIGTVCIATDITELKRTEEALRSARDELESRVVERTKELRRANTQLEREVTERKRSEERYRLLIESMQEGLWVIDREGVTTLVNPRLAQILDHDAQGMVGRPITEFFDEAGAAACVASLHEAQQGSLDQHDWEILRRDGARVYSIVQIAPLHDAEQRYDGAVLTVVDVTERRRMRAQLAQTERLASLGLLAAGVGHEINNPLTLVLNNLQLVEEALAGGDDGAPPDHEEIVECLTSARSGAERVRKIVAALRTFSRADDSPVPIAVDRAIEAAVNMSLNVIMHRARFIKEYGETAAVIADEGRLSQVFLNLLINATQAIEAGDVEDNEIRVRTWQQDGVVHAEVRDTGGGIAPENIDRLFEPFFTTRRAGEGSGLGLAICRRIVTSYGGELSVESEPGQWTRFVVRLPKADEEEVRAAKGGAGAAAAAPSAAPPIDATGRILLIDDEVALHPVVRRLLRRHEVVEVVSGEEGKKLLESDSNYDVVLCDLMMPGISGMDLFEWLQDEKPELARRVVFITGGAFTPEAEEHLRRGERPVLAKPFEPQELVRVVEEVMRERRTH